MTPKNENGIFWAYFSKDGYCQVRTIGKTKKESRENLEMYDMHSYKDYERVGWVCKKMRLQITAL